MGSATKIRILLNGAWFTADYTRAFAYIEAIPNQALRRIDGQVGFQLGTSHIDGRACVSWASRLFVAGKSFYMFILTGKFLYMNITLVIGIPHPPARPCAGAP